MGEPGAVQHRECAAHIMAKKRGVSGKENHSRGNGGRGGGGVSAAKRKKKK